MVGGNAPSCIVHHVRRSTHFVEANSGNVGETAGTSWDASEPAAARKKLIGTDSEGRRPRTAGWLVKTGRTQPVLYGLVLPIVHR